MDELFQYLEGLSPLPAELRAMLVGRTRKETFRRGRPLLSAGDRCDWLGFIEKGLVKVCYDVPGGNERIVCFLRAGEMMAFVRSFSGSLPSKLSIIALDEVVVRKIPLREAEAVAERYPAFHYHLRRLTEIQASLIEEHYMLLTESAKERLSKVETVCGWMLKDRRIRQYMIADYLGVDRATMSRWKGR